MTEEESFVILGSSPSSMENYSIIHQLTNQNGKENVSGQVSLENDGGGTINGVDTVKSADLPIDSNDKKVLEEDSTKDNQKTNISVSAIFKNFPANCSISEDKKSMSSSIDAQKTNKSVYGSLSMTKENSLAASFLLGEIDPEVLKASVFSQFPSLSTSQPSSEDVAKMQKFFFEYVALKSSVMKNNNVMKEHINFIQTWQKEFTAYKEKQDIKMKECYELVAKLRNENMELKRELDTKLEQIHVNENLMKAENENLVRLLSEKSSIIQNMGVHVQKLEKNQLTSFEYVNLNEDDKSLEHEYILASEHERIMKNMRRELSEVLAAKLELEDMRKLYIDEIDCLKVNLTAAEELIKSNQSEISILKSKDMEKSELFGKFDSEKEAMRQEIDLLRTQLEVYIKDFQAERNSRESLASEKEQLISDLKMLQRRNQQLIEEIASYRLEMESKNCTATGLTSKRRTTSSAFSAATSSRVLPSTSRMSPATSQEEQVYTRSQFVCPLCQESFKCMDYLQNHVHACLDNA